MIIGTGIDIIEVERVEQRVGSDNGFRELVFSKDEILYCDSKAFPFQHYAGRFAAKEAFLKAIGRGWDSGLALHEIEVVNLPNGKPELRLCGANRKGTGLSGHPFGLSFPFTPEIRRDGNCHPGIMKPSSDKNFPELPEIRKIQEKKLQELLQYLKTHSPYYQNIFEKNQIDITRISGFGWARFTSQPQLRKTCRLTMMHFFVYRRLQLLNIPALQVPWGSGNHCTY